MNSEQKEQVQWLLPSKRRLLDLCCGPGGAATGYARVGFEITGVDMSPQPHYPYPFIQADAFHFLATADLSQFDAIHVSPFCQEYSQSRYLRRAVAPHLAPKPKQIRAFRECLERTSLPWIIENVAGSDLPAAVELCGSMFGLPIRRHRWFAASFLLFAPGPCRHTDSCINPIGGKVRGYGSLSTHTYQDAKGHVRKREAYLPLATGQAAMGIDWMTLKELSQAIPPAYTAWVGQQLLEVLS